MGELADGPTGLENVSSSDMAMPFIRVANPLSKAVQEGPDKMDGVKVGDIYCKTLGRNWGKTARFIVAGYNQSYAEKDKTDKTKTVGVFTPGEVGRMQTKSEGLQLYTLEGAELIDNRNFFVLDADNPDGGIMVLSLQKSGIPFAKTWITKMKALRIAGRPAPMWSHVWTIGADYFKGDKGSYYALSTLTDNGLVPEENALYARAAFDEVSTISRVHSAED
jgi:hypothetical protein